MAAPGRRVSARMLVVRAVLASVAAGLAIAGTAHGADAPSAVEAATAAERIIVSPFLEKSGSVILALLAMAQMLAVLRLLQGPSLADRVVALDFIGVACAGMIGVYSVITEEPLYLRAAIVLSLVSFLGTIGFALYCEKRGVA